MHRVLVAMSLGLVSLVGLACGSNDKESIKSTSPTTAAATSDVNGDASNTSFLDCSPLRTEYVDGVGDGGGQEDPRGEPTPGAALRRYVGVDEATLPDSGYVAILGGDGEWVHFVLKSGDGRPILQVRVGRQADGWHAVGHGRCV